MAIVQSQIWNPVTGIFGTGQMQIFAFGGPTVWVVPAGIDRVRVRLWGGGAGVGGGGGGFAIKTIYGLAGVTSVPVAVGNGGYNINGYSIGGTSSFGNYVSATGGTNGSFNTGGVGIGGDINYAGGVGVAGDAGGGAANLFGNGGSASQTVQGPGTSGAGGSNAGSAFGQNGLFGQGGGATITAIPGAVMPTSGLEGRFSIDLLGTGGGGGSAVSGVSAQSGINGGGGGKGGTSYLAHGGVPGGGGGALSFGASGMVIVEW